MTDRYRGGQETRHDRKYAAVLLILAALCGRNRWESVLNHHLKCLLLQATSDRHVIRSDAAAASVCPFCVRAHDILQNIM